MTTIWSNGDISNSQTLTNNDHWYPVHINELRGAVNTAESNISTLQAALNNHVYVVVAADGTGDFNCDGVNDQVEINAAITALPAGGGSVFIKRGTYDIQSAILVSKSNVTVTGEGQATILKRHAGPADTNIMTVNNGGSGSSTLRGIIIRNLTFDSNQANTVSAAGSGIYVYYTSYSVFENCNFINNVESGIFFYDVQRSSMRNNFFNTSRNGALVRLFSTPDNVFQCAYDVLEGNILDTTSRYGGMVISDVIGCVVNNNVLVNIAENAIEISQGDPGSSSGTYYNVVSNNTINGFSLLYGGTGINAYGYSIITGNVVNGVTTGQAGEGIRIFNTGNTNLCQTICSNNVVSNCGGNGLLIDTGSNAIISNNLFYDNGLDTTNTYADILVTNSGHNMIMGNVIRATKSIKTGWGIKETGTSNNNYINNNMWTGNATAGITVLGGATVQSNNQNL